MNETSQFRSRPGRRRLLAVGLPAGLVVVLVAALVAAWFVTRSGGGPGDQQALAGGIESSRPSAPPAGAVVSSSVPPSAKPAASTSTAPTVSGKSAPGADGGSSACPLPKYPKPSCTGVPAGTRLSTLALNIDNDSYAVRTANTVIDGKHIPGNLLIWADNITVRNTQIDGTVFNEQNGTKYPYTITDSTVGLSAKCITSPGLTSSNYTARRVQVLGHDDGFRVDTPGDVKIYDSYAKLCWNPPALAPPDGSHSGGIQADCRIGVCHNAVFIHNTIDNRGPNGNSGMTYMSFDGNPTSGWTANDNLVMGGSYTVIFWWTQGPDYEVHDNRVVDGQWAYGPADARGSCAHQHWSGNTVVKIDSDYDVTSTVRALSCVN